MIHQFIAVLFVKIQKQVLLFILRVAKHEKSEKCTSLGAFQHGKPWWWIQAWVFNMVMAIRHNQWNFYVNRSFFFRDTKCFCVFKRCWSFAFASFLQFTSVWCTFKQFSSVNKCLTMEKSTIWFCQRKLRFPCPNGQFRDELRTSHISLASFKSLFQYYKKALNLYDIDDIRTLRTSCPTCNTARSLLCLPMCCF